MSLTPVTRNFASVTRCVFPNRVFFSGGASLRFASSKCFRVGDEKTQKRSRLPSSDFYEYSFAKFEKIAQCSISFANFARNCENSLFYGLNRKIVEESPAPITVGTTGGPVVKTFASGAEVLQRRRFESQSGQKLEQHLQVLQSGDPNMIFTHHTCCKNYRTTG